MSWKGLIALLALVGTLLYFNSERNQELQSNIEDRDKEYVLFPDLQPELVSEIRIDNLERSYQIKFERDGQGIWYLTDPVPYPAIGSIVTSLLNAIHTGLAQRVELEDQAGLGLDPPKVVVQIEQVLGGEVQSFRLDLGEPGLNKNRIYARIQHNGEGGQEVVSITRAIYNALVRFPKDYRDPSALHVQAANVISFRRKGAFWNRELEREVNLDLDMERDGAQWQRVDAPRMSLNPQIAGFLVNSAARLKVENFEADLPEDLSRFGLAEPRFSIELTSGDETPRSLAFGHPAAGSNVDIETWYFMRVGFPHVWSIERGKILMLTTPAEDLYNPYLVQALREDIQKLELRVADELVIFERESVLNKDRWFMTVRPDEGEEKRFPANLGQVKDLLAKLEGAEINYAEDIDFVDAESTGSVGVFTKDGTLFGGELGERWKDSERGLVGYRFKRFGDELPGLMDESLAELFQPGGLDPSDFRSTVIHHIRWADAFRIELSHAGKQFVYTHPEDKRWTVDPGEDKRKLDAPAVFTDSVLPMLSLFAEEWLEDFDASQLENRLGVVVFDATSAGLSFEVGQDSEGRWICVENGSVALIRSESLRNFEASHGTGLFEGLIELFQDE